MVKEIQSSHTQYKLIVMHANDSVLPSGCFLIRGWWLNDRGKGVPSFDEMMDIALVAVDFDDPTTNVRGRRALAIAKPTPRGYWPRRSTINLTTRVCFLRAIEEQARNWDCNLDIANIRWKLYWSRWGSVTPLSGRWTQTKYAKLQLWRTFNLNKTQK